MPNHNYRAGRNFEYAVRKHYAKRGMVVLRSAGSHGIFDLCAFEDGKPPIGIQCKRVTTKAEAERLAKGFRAEPPLTRCPFYRQILEVQIKELRKTISVEA